MRGCIHRLELRCFSPYRGGNRAVRFPCGICWGICKALETREPWAAVRSTGRDACAGYQDSECYILHTLSGTVDGDFERKGDASNEGRHIMASGPVAEKQRPSFAGLGSLVDSPR